MTDPLDPTTFPYLTIENCAFDFLSVKLLAATNNLSDASLVPPYKLTGLTALSVDKGNYFLNISF